MIVVVVVVDAVVISDSSPIEKIIVYLAFSPLYVLGPPGWTWSDKTGLNSMREIRGMFGNVSRQRRDGMGFPFWPSQGQRE